MFFCLDLEFLLCYTKNRRSNHSATCDSDLGLYYLGANGDLNAYNLYAYCDNNPVMRVDYGGEFWIAVLIAATITTDIHRTIQGILTL